MPATNSSVENSERPPSLQEGINTFFMSSRGVQPSNSKTVGMVHTGEAESVAIILELAADDGNS